MCSKSPPPGRIEQTDYSQLLAKGSVTLDDAVLGVLAHPGGEDAACPRLTSGETFTFVSTAGTLTGTFANAPEGGPEISVEFSEECPETKKMRIRYNRSGPTETVTGEVEAEAREKQEVKEREQREAHEQEVKAQKKHEEEVALARRHEEEAIAAGKKHVEEEASAAAARKQQEEAAAAQRRAQEQAGKGEVLGVSEGSPDATIAGISLQVSASGAFTLEVSCPTGVSDCVGTVSLHTLDAVVASRAGASTSKAAILTLASGSFVVPGGERKALTLRLSGKARALLARVHTVRARATITAHDATGGAHTAHVIVTLRRRR